MNLAPYRKAIVALIGAAVIIANRLVGSDLGLGASAQDIADLVILVLTPAAVFAVRNDPAAK